jgi:hypothetical protein
MRLSIFYIIATLVITTSCGNLQGQEQSSNANAIVKIELVSMNFNVHTRSNWSWTQLWTTRSGNDIFRTTITEPIFLDSLTAYVEQITSQRPTTESLDTRVACLLYRKNGITDSLGMDRFGIELNGKQYPISRPLLLLIAERLAEGHRKAIKKSIEVQEKMTKEDRERILKESEKWHTDD